MTRAQVLSVLTIAGSDSGGGAGIQADLKTFAAYGVHGTCALAALTAQNTRGVTALHVPPREFLRAQLDAVFDDFVVVAVKLGMLATADVIHTVADALEQRRPTFVVVDPVMVATSGARLLEGDALDALRTRLFPLATILTPNIPEAELLLGHSIVSSLARGGSARFDDDESADRALDELLALGARAVLLKGGHMPSGGELVDRLGEGATRSRYVHARLDLEGHGTGCTLAAAIAACLARGHDLQAACKDAADYVHGALRNAYYPGKAQLAVLDHGWRSRPA